MALTLAQFLENAGSVNHARDFRRMQDKLLGWDVRIPNAGLATTGIANGGVARYYGAATTGDLAVVQRGAGANMSVDVGAGFAMVGGTESATQGEYGAYNDATVNVTISASDPTNPRIDVIGIRIRDTEYSGANNDAAIIVVTGTPAASPAVPTLPNDFLSLAHVAVAALAASIVTGNITDKRRNLTSLGGVIVADSDTLLPTVNLWNGQVAFVRSSAAGTTQPVVYVCDGTNWVPLGQYARAWTVLTDTLLGSDTTISFTTIAQTFTHLELILIGRGNAAVGASNTLVRFNGDNSAIYDYVRIGTTGPTTVLADVLEGQTQLIIGQGLGTTATANRSAFFRVTMPNYRATTFQRAGSAEANYEDAGVAAEVSQRAWAYRSTTAISQIDPSFNAVGTGWKSGTRATLIGIR